MLQRREAWFIGLFVLSVILLQIPNNYTNSFALMEELPTNQLSFSDVILLRYHNIQIDIISSDQVYVTEICGIENTFNYSITTIDYWLNHSCSNITVQDSEGVITANVLSETSSYYHFNFDLNQELQVNETTVFYISYNLDMMPLYVEDLQYYYFEYASTVNYYTLNQFMSIKLPENSYVRDEPGLTSIYPSNYTQNVVGKRLIISWSLPDLQPAINPIFIIRFDPPSLEPSDLPIWAFIAGPLLGISIGVASTYYLMRKKEDQSIKDMGVLFLNESQKILLKIVKESGGKIAQSELGRKADFTRAKTSRNLLLLEEQGLVRKETWGRNAIVYLTKAGEKVIE